MRALAFLMNSVRLSHGDAAVDALLQEGRRLFHDEGTHQERADVLQMLSAQESFLSERGGGSAILADAFKDGSSVFCRRCEGLVARARWDAHSTMWCPKLDHGDEDEEHEEAFGDAMDTED